jgi:hypothetical protein
MLVQKLHENEMLPKKTMTIPFMTTTKKRKNAVSVVDLLKKGTWTLFPLSIPLGLNADLSLVLSHCHYFFTHLSYPLFKPCQCSGSIGIRFAPQYAENTPERLPASQVQTILFRRAIAWWLPFTIRSLFAASLWLVVAPLVTAYLYHCWIARPTAILERFRWNIFVVDLISGAVLAAIIIVSFLSLMSFADFLRFEWQQRGIVPRIRGGPDRNRLKIITELTIPPVTHSPDLLMKILIMVFGIMCNIKFCSNQIVFRARAYNSW